MRRWIAAVDLAATLAPGFGDAGGVGFGLSVRAYVWPSLAVHASGGMRFGNVDAAEASSSVGFGAVGATWRWLELRNPLPIDLGARGDLLAMYLALSRSGTRQSRWIPGARLSAEAAGFLTPNVGIVLAAGGEAMFGTTQVVVGSEATGELAPVHFFTEVGARVRF